MRDSKRECKYCKSNYTYALVDGTIVCRACGFKSMSEREELKDDLVLDEDDDG